MWCALGFLVILPDWYRGKIYESDSMDKLVAFVKEETKWDDMRKIWEEKIKPFANANGAQVFGAIGTCWGTYPVLKLNALEEFKVGVHMHPR